MVRQWLGIWRHGRGLAAILVAATLVLAVAACQTTRSTGGDQPMSDANTAPAPPANSIAPGGASTGTLHLPTEAIKQSGTLTLSAEGFAPGEAVSLQVILTEGDPPNEVWRGQADEAGRVPEQEIVLPEWLTSGVRPLDLVGEASGTRATAPVAIRARELWIQASGYGVQVAQKFGFIAGGFEPEENVHAYFVAQPDVPQDATPVLTAISDRAGNIQWQEFQVPVVVGGPYHLILVGETSGERLDQVLTVDPLHPYVELEPWSGPPGATVAITAHGLLPNEEVDLFVGGTQPTATVKADEWGNLWSAGPITVPIDSAGTQATITVVGRESKQPATANFGIQAPKPWLELDTYSGYPGSYVQFSGGGFAAGEQVRVYRVGETDALMGVGTTYNDGSFWNIGPASVGGILEGKVTFVAVGDQTGARATATFEVIPPPGYWEQSSSNPEAPVPLEPPTDSPAEPAPETPPAP